MQRLIVEKLYCPTGRKVGKTMKNIVNLVKLNRQNRKPLSLADFGDKVEFSTYTKAVDTVQVALSKWAFKDWQGIEDKNARDAAFDAVRELLAIFNDEDLKIKADATSLRSLRDMALGKKTEYSEEYKTATKRKASFIESIKIHINDLQTAGVIVPLFSDYAELQAWAKENGHNALDTCINSYDKVIADIEEIKLGNWSWYVPYCNNKAIFRVMVENFIADRAEKCQFETIDIEAIRAARREKNKLRREAKKAEAKAKA
jgi:hypothetical protein